jgi:hypothetical protein
VGRKIIFSLYPESVVESLLHDCQQCQNTPSVLRQPQQQKQSEDRRRISWRRTSSITPSLRLPSVLMLLLLVATPTVTTDASTKPNSRCGADAIVGRLVLGELMGKDGILKCHDDMVVVERSQKENHGIKYGWCSLCTR